TVVIALGNYMGDGFLHPFGWFVGAQLVEHQYLGIKDRRQDSKLRRVSIGVVAVLNLFQKIAKIVEQRWNALVDQSGQYRGRQVRFAHAACSYKEQANVDHRVFVYVSSRYHEGPLNRRTSDLEIIKAAALVTRRNIGSA